MCTQNSCRASTSIGLWSATSTATSASQNATDRHTGVRTPAPPITYITPASSTPRSTTGSNGQDHRTGIGLEEEVERYEREQADSGQEDEDVPERARGGAPDPEVARRAGLRNVRDEPEQGDRQLHRQ